MIATTAPKLLCYPPAPINGGRLDTAPAKIGAWNWQPKIDDWRAMVHTPTRTVWNQYGQLSSFTDTGKFTAALDLLAGSSFASEWLDVGMMENRNDMMRGSIVVLDLVDAALTQAERRDWLESLFPVLPWATELIGKPIAYESVYLIPQVSGEDAGRALYCALQAQNATLKRKFYEGVVAKRAGSLYPTHRQAPKIKTAEWIKHRFDQ